MKAETNGPIEEPKPTIAQLLVAALESAKMVTESLNRAFAKSAKEANEQQPTASSCPTADK
jgi:hypothetical protein